MKILHSAIARPHPPPHPHPTPPPPPTAPPTLPTPGHVKIKVTDLEFSRNKMCNIRWAILSGDRSCFSLAFWAMRRWWWLRLMCLPIVIQLYQVNKRVTKCGHGQSLYGWIHFTWKWQESARWNAQRHILVEKKNLQKISVWQFGMYARQSSAASVNWFASASGCLVSG